jgi:hypothetical protein
MIRVVIAVRPGKDYDSKFHVSPPGSIGEVLFYHTSLGPHQSPPKWKRGQPNRCDSHSNRQLILEGHTVLARQRPRKQGHENKKDRHKE